MQTRVIDVIIFLMQHIQEGEPLNDINLEQFEEFEHLSKAEVSAAYSWVIQNRESQKLKSHLTKEEPSEQQTHRILHFAERLIISGEAYGYLLELLNIGILDSKQMERIIENIMLNMSERIDLAKMKEIVGKQMFDSSMEMPIHSVYLKGNEQIN